MTLLKDYIFIMHFAVFVNLTYQSRTVCDLLARHGLCELLSCYRYLIISPPSQVYYTLNHHEMKLLLLSTP